MANHGWTWVRQAALRPNRCAVFPHIPQGALIDTGVDLLTHDPHIYIGEVAAKELGKMAGMVPGASLKKADETISALRTQIDELQDEILRLQTFKDAVNLVKAEL